MHEVAPKSVLHLTNDTRHIGMACSRTPSQEKHRNRFVESCPHDTLDRIPLQDSPASITSYLLSVKMDSLKTELGMLDIQ